MNTIYCILIKNILIFIELFPKIENSGSQITLEKSKINTSKN
jgi:hypothetical protein